MADVWISARTGGDQLAVAEGDYLPGWAGNWTAHLELANYVLAPTGLVTVSWLGEVLTGQVVRSGQTKGGRVFVLVAGGSGHLSKADPPKLAPKGYQNCPVSRVLQELASDAGETVNATISPQILTRTLASWPRRNAPASACLDDLARHLGCLWRVLRDGSIWLGVPDFAEATLAQPLQLLDDQDPAESTALYTVRSFGPLPGQSYEGKRISEAHYQISASGDGLPGPGAFVRLWWIDAASSDLDGGKLMRDFADLVKQVVTLDWLASYSARVVSQAADGTLEVVFDTKLLPPRKRVPYRVMVDGAKLVIDAGARCNVHFENGKPESPVADLFEPGPATKGVARLNDPVAPNAAFATWINQVQAAINAISAGAVTPWVSGADFGKITAASQKVFLP